MSRKSGALKAKNVITSLVICTAVCLIGVGYVWAKMEVWDLSAAIKKLELRRDELQRANEGLQRTYSSMCTQGQLDARVKQLNLGVSSPDQSQFIWLPDPSSLPRQTNVPVFLTGKTN